MQNNRVHLKICIPCSKLGPIFQLLFQLAVSELWKFSPLLSKCSILSFREQMKHVAQMILAIHLPMLIQFYELPLSRYSTYYSYIDILNLWYKKHTTGLNYKWLSLCMLLLLRFCVCMVLFQYHEDHQYHIHNQILKPVTCTEPSLSGMWCRWWT